MADLLFIFDMMFSMSKIKASLHLLFLQLSIFILKNFGVLLIGFYAYHWYNPNA
jgi:hypothetical protein